MAQPRYIRVLNGKSRMPFSALGVLQRNSTTWFDDQLWWGTVVEFQSSKRNDGAFLNVGVCWLFYPKDYLSFDLGYREFDLATYEDDAQFDLVAERFVGRATQKLTELRTRLSTTSDAWHFANKLPSVSKTDPWFVFQNGVLAGLADEWKESSDCLDKIASGPVQWDWERARAGRAVQLRDALPDRARFRATVAEFVAQTRVALGLPSKEIQFI